MNSFIQFLLVISFICYDGIDPSPQKKLTKKQKGIIESLVSFADSLNGKIQILQHNTYKNCHPKKMTM